MVENGYIRPQEAGAGIRSVAAATMAGYHDLSDFERGVIVDEREMGHSISKVAIL